MLSCLGLPSLRYMAYKGNVRGSQCMFRQYIGRVFGLLPGAKSATSNKLSALISPSFYSDWICDSYAILRASSTGIACIMLCHLTGRAPIPDIACLSASMSTVELCRTTFWF